MQSLNECKHLLPYFKLEDHHPGTAASPENICKLVKNLQTKKKEGYSIKRKRKTIMQYIFSF